MFAYPFPPLKEYPSNPLYGVVTSFEPEPPSATSLLFTYPIRFEISVIRFVMSVLVVASCVLNSEYAVYKSEVRFGSEEPPYPAGEYVLVMQFDIDTDVGAEGGAGWAGTADPVPVRVTGGIDFIAIISKDCFEKRAVNFVFKFPIDVSKAASVIILEPPNEPTAGST